MIGKVNAYGKSCISNCENEQGNPEILCCDTDLCNTGERVPSRSLLATVGYIILTSIACYFQ